MHTTKRFAWLIGGLAMLFGPGLANGATLRLATDTEGDFQYFIDDGPPGIVQIHVVLGFGEAVQAIFSAPVPDCFKGAVWMSDESPGWLTIGDSQTGVVVDSPGCLRGPVHLLTMNIYAAGLSDTCCIYGILAHPELPRGPMVLNCDGQLEPAFIQPMVIGESDDHIILPPPEDPLPPNGATDQPLNLALDWSAVDCLFGLGNYVNKVYFGTSPDPPWLQDVNGPPFGVGPLEPNTTYYWKIIASQTNPPGHGESPVWSLTTGTDVPTEKATWGAIKALFR